MVIKFIYFDVGGVVALDFSKTNKWDELLDDLGVNIQDRPEFNKLFDEEEPRYCMGKFRVDDFFEKYRDKFKLNLSPKYSFLDDFVSRFEPNPGLWILLPN